MRALLLIASLALVGTGCDSFEASDSVTADSGVISGPDVAYYKSEYNGCTANYNSSGVLDWTISGNGTLAYESSSLAVVQTTSWSGSFTITAHYSSGSTSKTVALSKARFEWQCP